METVILDTISEYNEYFNHETLHPLVSVVNLSKAKPRQMARMNVGFYHVILKDVGTDSGKGTNLRYGKNYYDFQKGTILFMAPGQVIAVEKEGDLYQPKGQALVFHPDLLHGTSLGRHINDYTFFSYNVNEALHLSEREQAIVKECFSKIRYEIEHAIDKHSKRVIVSNIELFLNYSLRFYERQFNTRDHVNKGIIEKFETLLNDFFQSDKPQKVGLPSVAWCAGELHLSSNYFGDLVKKETGKSALEYIQSKVIDIAKEKIFDLNKSVADIASELGFKYPHHFTRLFKQKAGVTPMEFRGLN